jgi:hypothetical protein
LTLELKFWNIDVWQLAREVARKSNQQSIINPRVFTLPLVENFPNSFNMINQIGVGDMVVYGKVECIRQEQVIKIKTDFV